MKNPSQTSSHLHTTTRWCCAHFISPFQHLPPFSVQAMARVWRDGQKKPVHIYRLLTAGLKTQGRTMTKSMEQTSNKSDVSRYVSACVASLQALLRSGYSRDKCPNKGSLGQWLTWAKGRSTPASPPANCEIFSA